MSLGFSKDGQRFACGSNQGHVWVYTLMDSGFDSEYHPFKLEVKGGISCLTFGPSDSLFLADTQGYIFQYGAQGIQTRKKAKEFCSYILDTELKSVHTDRIVRMCWSTDENLLAVGGNDNLVSLWRFGQTQAPYRILNGHSSAVRALSWCPWKPDLLLTGAGLNDPTIRFFNTKTGECLKSFTVESQVLDILCSTRTKEWIMIQSCLEKPISLWSFGPKFERKGWWRGHDDARVLYSALSPNGEILLTAAANEHIKVISNFRNFRLIQ